MKKIILAGLFSILLTSLLWVFPVRATKPAALAPTRTPTRRSRPTPTRTPLPSLLSILPGQLMFGGYGGGGYGIEACSGFLKTYRGAYPVAFIGERHLLGTSQVAPLCIAGLSMNGRLRIKLRTTAGKTIGSAVFESNPYIGSPSTVGIRQTSPVMNDDAGLSGRDENNLPIILIDILLSPDFPYTQLRIDASNNAGNFTGVIKEVIWGEDTPYLYVPSTTVDPFNLTPDESLGYNLTLGQQLVIKGINLAKNTYLPVAIYRQVNEKLEDADWIQSDSRGRISVPLRFDSSFPPGYYVLAVFSNPPGYLPEEYMEYLFADTCPGAPSSHLSVGDQVVINPQIPESNNIRRRAGLKSSVVGTLKVNQIATVIDGWRCAEQMVWWKIRTSAGIEGWTSEGKGDQYWIVQGP